jgi:hypothetical protein
VANVKTTGQKLRAAAASPTLRGCAAAGATDDRPGRSGRPRPPAMVFTWSWL